jgi:hypothetical protein
MVDLSISGGNLVLHVRGADKLWAFKSSLEIPLVHITEITADHLYYIDLAIAAQVLLVKDSVSDNWRLVVAIRKPKVNLLNPRVRHCEFKKRSFNGRSCRPLTPLRRTPIQ